MKTILIIEDDKVVASIYEKKFQQAGFEVECVHDGQEGFYRLHAPELSTKLTALVLDLMLPHIGGLDILKKIRAQKRFDALPVFVLTNAFLGEVGHEAQKAGATHIFNKATTTPKKLVEQIQSLLSKDGEAAWLEAPPGFQPSNPNAGAEQTIPGMIEQARKCVQALGKTIDPAVRQTLLLDLIKLTHGVTSRASVGGMATAAHVSSALEAFLNELGNRITELNPSTQHTISMAVDFIAGVCRTPDHTEAVASESFNILVVDDERFSRHAASHALNKAGLKPLVTSLPSVALQLAMENKLDLVVSDVDMPGLNGFELCKRIHTTPENHDTPVVFVTGLTDFESGVQAASSGGNDLIAKPFLPMELGLKALMLLHRQKLARKNANSL
ncbi:MAG: response regulator receiver protein [Verrucomicrobiales bacterium]|nr:response regulator receiver protein [Verrucomicrobiales bacterium]